jgi:hypothetical protein
MLAKRRVPLGVWLAMVHLFAFSLSFAYVQSSVGWQSVWIWLFWMPVDFPWSLLHLVAYQKDVAHWLDATSAQSSFLSYALYPPYIIHGFIGTIWWGFLPTLRRKFRSR